MTHQCPNGSAGTFRVRQERRGSGRALEAAHHPATVRGVLQAQLELLERLEVRAEAERQRVREADLVGNSSVTHDSSMNNTEIVRNCILHYELQ